MNYVLMGISAVIVLVMTVLLRNKSKFNKTIGSVSWISLSLYFPVEYIVIRGTTVPYHFMHQPMSDLGVTSCGTDTYVLAYYEICSPYHLLMNWTLTLTGVVVFIGAVFLHRRWPEQRQTKIATVLLSIFGVSYGISGIFPADENFMVHTLATFPGMFVQIPALILIGSAIRKYMPKLSKWTFFCAFLTTASLVLLCLQPLFTELPGGLLQRMLYCFVWLWMIVTGIVFLRNKITQ